MKETYNKNKKKYIKRFVIGFIIWICILSIGVVRKSFQNDTLYTIKIGELILNNGIDMLDHFSFHTGMAYTYPHWLYDVFIYIIYYIGGFRGIYISTIILLMVLLIVVFKTNVKICENVSIAAFSTFICALAISSFAAARAQLVSYILFALQICFIEMLLKTGKKKYMWGLLLISLIICNIHVAVWPFYFILYLPYLVEWLVAFILSKVKLKKERKFILFLKKKFILEKNDNIKYLFIVFILSIFMGIMTPIGDTPYTYLIKTMMGNSQKYIKEHQMLSWANSPFTIIIVGEVLFLAIFNKVKLRDLFMICGLGFMSIMSIRHLSLLSLIGTICFARVFSMFASNFNTPVDDKIIPFIFKRRRYIYAFIIVIIFSSYFTYTNTKKDYLDEKIFPIDAVKYIKSNLNYKEIRLFNEYNFGSYLLFEDIPVFIDSRADLYTKQFSGFDYDVFDDFEYVTSNYKEKFEFYKITHLLIYKTNPLYNIIKNDINYKQIYDDDNYALYEKNNIIDYVVTSGNGTTIDFNLKK